MKKSAFSILAFLFSYNTYSQTLSQCTTDSNNDGVTNTSDFLNLVGQFGQNCSPLGTISSFTCSDFTNSGTLIQGSEALNVNSIISYSVGNGGHHNGQVVSSTGVTGLYAALQAGSFTSGAGSLTYMIFGTPTSSGIASFALNIGGQTCALTRTVNGSGSGPLNIETALIPAGTFTMGSPTTEPERGTDEEQHQVTLSAFRMSKYETSNGQFAAFLNAKSIGSNGLYALGAYPSEPLIYDCGQGNGLSYTGSQWQAAAGFENHPYFRS